MIAIDTNVLVYAVNSDDPAHEPCRQFVSDALATRLVRVPWTVLYEFLRVATHRAVLPHPLSTEQAWSFVETLLKAPSFRPLSETDRHADYAQHALSAPSVSGNLVHDAHIAAVLANHGVREIWTRDQDLHRFRDLTVRDPLTDRW